MKSKNIIILAFSIIIVLIFNYYGVFSTVNNLIYDHYIVLNEKPDINTEICIIEIDRKSIKELGRWPWDRSIYINLLKKVISYTPGVIGINLAFTEPSTKPADDKELQNILKSFSNIVLISNYKYKYVFGKKLLLPEKNLFSDLKYGQVLFEEKDVVRSFPPYKVVPAFSLLILKMYYSEESRNIKEKSKLLDELLKKTKETHYSTREHVLIDYQRSAKQYAHYSVVDVLQGKVNSDELKNKIVLIGATDSYITSFFATPYTRVKKHYASATIEIQAQIIDSLMNNRGLKEVPGYIVYLLSLFILIVFLYFIRGKTILFQGITLFFLISIVSVADFIAFKYFALWFPPVLLLFLIIITFGLSVYFKAVSADKQLIDTINNFHSDENIPLLDLPVDINSRVDTLNELLKIISSDRHTIKSIIDGVNNGILVFDVAGKVIWANQYILEIFEKALVLGQSIKEIIKDIEVDEITRKLDEDKTYKIELSLRGRDYFITVNYLNIQDKTFVGIFNDVTDLKELDRLKTDMVRMVSHELKTPLSTINMAVENIYSFEEREFSIKNAGIIDENTTYMSKTIENFLNLNKLESNITKLKLEKTNMGEVIKKSIQLNRAIADEKDIQFNIQVPENLFTLIDQNQMLVVFNNLLSNAIKYSNQGKAIDINLCERKSEIEISFVDYGIGIPEDEVSKIFNKFYRSTNNEENNIKGTGLGLSIVLKIIELHNGKITVTSSSGEGSKFTILLPLKK